MNPKSTKLELIDPNGTVVSSTQVDDPESHEQISEWLVPLGYTILDGKVMDMRTLPFRKTKLRVRPAKQSKTKG